MSRQTYDMLAMAESTGDLVMLTYAAPGPDCREWPADAPDLNGVRGHVAHYDPTAAKWTFSPTEATTWSSDSAAEYDAASGLIVIVGQTGLFTYDPVSRAAAFRMTPDALERLNYSAQLVAFPPTGRMYYFTRTGLVFEVAPDRNDWSKSTVVELTDMTGDIPAEGAKGWAYDPDHQLIGGGVKNGIFYAFDPASRSWTSRTIATRPDGRASGARRVVLYPRLRRSRQGLPLLHQLRRGQLDDLGLPVLTTRVDFLTDDRLSLHQER